MADPAIDPVRCVGHCRDADRAGSATAHNKCLVFCEIELSRDPPAPGLGEEVVVPRKVWTGSFNFSRTAPRCFDNTVLIEEPAIARAYFSEWGQITALSERNERRAPEPETSETLLPVAKPSDISAIPVEKAIPVYLRGGEGLGGYAGITIESGSALDTIYTAFRASKAYATHAAWVSPPDLPGHVALEVTYTKPIEHTVRFVFEEATQRECLEVIVRDRVLTIAPTGKSQELDPERGMYFSRLPVERLKGFLKAAGN